MDYKTLILFSAVLFNFIMSITVFTRGWKNPIYKYFSLMTFFNILWAVGLLFLRLHSDYEIVRFFSSFVYFAALLVVLNLFYFSIHFPFKIFHFHKIWQNILTACISLYSLYFIFFYQNFITKVNLIGVHTMQYEPTAYLIFTILLMILMLLSIIFLFVKYLRADKIFKKPLLLILVGVICGVLAGSYFNLLDMYFGGFDNYHFGPLFTLVINFMAFYLIFSKRDKQLEY